MVFYWINSNCYVLRSLEYSKITPKMTGRDTVANTVTSTPLNLAKIILLSCVCRVTIPLMKMTEQLLSSGVFNDLASDTE